MPVYQYDGVHYDLPEGLSNDQAIAKIQGYLGVSTKPKLPAQTGTATPESMVADPSNPFSFLGQEQQTEQGPAMQAVGQGVNRALQVGAGVAKGAVLNPVAAETEDSSSMQKCKKDMLNNEPMQEQLDLILQSLAVLQ